MVEPFDTYPGIEKVESGYTGGHVENPTYEQVKTGTTGHTEAVRITFDPAKVSYEQLVEIYWHQTDPTDAMGQFQDRGDNYRPVIFVKDEQQRQIALASRQKLADSGIFDDPIVTKIEDSHFIWQKTITRISTRKIRNAMPKRRLADGSSSSRSTGTLSF